MGEYRESSTRYAVPLVVFAVLVLIIVIASFGGSGGGSGTSQRSESQTNEKVQTNKTRERRFYTVKEGDSLLAISDKTGVSVSDLETLNPDLDPQALIAGQRIKLR